VVSQKNNAIRLT